jgi:uncharacterized protein (DUF433 family)
MSSRAQLLEAIAALPDELIAPTLTYVEALQQPIQKTPGVCGGAARVRNTRIPVWTLVAYREQGAADEELLMNYPGLTATDLGLAWAYYEAHREEVDRLIAENE